MKQQGVSIAICMLMVFAAVVPLVGASSMIGSINGQASVQEKAFQRRLAERVDGAMEP